MLDGAIARECANMAPRTYQYSVCSTGVKDDAADGETPVRLNLVAAWRESTVFTDAEQAALAIPEWNAIPDALHWLTVARYRLGGVDTARATLFGLAWRLPASGRKARAEVPLCDRGNPPRRLQARGG
jgi:alkylhydroperoxidase family enzyme